MASVPLSILVLAAGFSRRASPHNKLLTPVNGQPMIRATVRATLESGVGPVTVVTGYENERVEAALADLPVHCVVAENYSEGMGRSLAAGIASLPRESAGIMVTPGDLPYLTPHVIQQIAAGFSFHGAQKHIVPTYEGERGHPVVLGAWIRPQLENLRGDIGARQILLTPVEQPRIHFLAVDDPSILHDIDYLPNRS